jgi:hypothetical protein
VQFVGISIDTAKRGAASSQAPVAYPLVIAEPVRRPAHRNWATPPRACPSRDRRRNGNISLVKLGMLSEEELDRKLAELSKS